MKKIMVALGLVLTALTATASPASATDNDRCPGLSFKIDNLDGPTYTVPIWEDYEIFAISVKAGPDEHYYEVTEGQTLNIKLLTGHDVSHVHLCKRQNPPATTTTTTSTTTTTTVPEETTTSTSTTSTTSTTAATTTTTEPEETTTTTSESPSTTSGPTSTTTSVAPSTTVPVTTTSSPTSTVSPTTTVAPSTTAPGTTTSTGVTTPSTAETTTTTTSNLPGNNLPPTGSDGVSPLLILGGLFVFLGGIALVVKRMAR